MPVGDPAAWVNRFRSFDVQFLQRVVAIWPRCLAVLPPRPDEDTITTNLVSLLVRDPDVRHRFHWIEYQYEPFGHAPDGTAYSRGRVDIAVAIGEAARFSSRHRRQLDGDEIEIRHALLPF